MKKVDWAAYVALRIVIIFVLPIVALLIASVLAFALLKLVFEFN